MRRQPYARPVTSVQRMLLAVGCIAFAIFGLVVAMRRPDTAAIDIILALLLPLLFYVAVPIFWSVGDQLESRDADRHPR